MSEKLIPGGYILTSRKIINSKIWSKPPLYFKIWVYLLLKAQHQEYKNLKRGQLRTSIAEIQDAMSYMVGYRIERPSKKQVWGVLEWLRNPDERDTKGTATEPMIETTKVTHGILVNVVNYNLYQDAKSYEGNTEGNTEGIANGKRTERQGNNINKNVKNVKNERIYIVPKGTMSNSSEDEPTFTEIINFFKENCKALPEVKILTKKRKQSINARIKEHGQEAVFAMLKKAGQSCFLAGQNNKGWTATFDWIFKPENFVKVLEGNYDNIRQSPTNGSGIKNKPSNMIFDQQREYSDSYTEDFFK